MCKKDFSMKMIEKNTPESHDLLDNWMDRYFDQHSVKNEGSVSSCTIEDMEQIICLRDSLTKTERWNRRSFNTQTSWVTDEEVSVINYRKYHGDCSYKDEFCFPDPTLEYDEFETTEDSSGSSPSWPGRFFALARNSKKTQKSDGNPQRFINAQPLFHSTSVSSLPNTSSEENNFRLSSSEKSSRNLLRSFSFGSSNIRLFKEKSTRKFNTDLLEDWPP